MASYADLRKGKDLAKRSTAKPHQVRWKDNTGPRSKQFTRKAEADKHLRDMQAREESGEWDSLTAGKQTLATAGAKFVKLERSTWSDTTYDEHRYLWNSVILGRGSKGYPRAELADMQVKDIRKSHVTEFREVALAAGVPKSSVTRVLSLITRTLDMVEDDTPLPTGNPAARVKSPDPKPVGSIVIVTPAEVEKLRAGFEDERDKVLISILAYAGLRPHEALALHPEQFGGPELHLTHAVGSKGEIQALKAGHDERYVPICAALAADVKAVKWGTGPMFPNIHGDYRSKDDYDNWRNRRFAKARKAAELPKELIPYDLRHSIASLWYREGIDKGTIADWLGHSIQVLETRYLHRYKQLDPGDKRTVDEMIRDARSVPAAA